MTDQTPTQVPPGSSAAGAGEQAGTGTQDSAPTLPAPGSGESSGSGSSSGSASGGAVDPAKLAAAPLLDPANADSVAATAGAGAVTTTWQNSKKVTGLWSINQNCNSWAALEGIGWKKLCPAPETATMALSILAASAKATQGPVNCREEPDGQIHEIYAF